MQVPANSSSTQRLLRLAAQCLEEERQGAEGVSFQELASIIDELIDNRESFTELIEQARQDSPILGQYLLRVCRSVASEAEFEIDGHSRRLVVGGIGLLLPSELELSHPTWVKAVTKLTNGLSALWVDEVESVGVSQAPCALGSLALLSPTGLREEASRVFNGSNSFEGLAFESPTEHGWQPYVIPFIAVLEPSKARDFVRKALMPGAPTQVLMALKHRFESCFEEAGLTPPLMFPPSSWPNIFSMMRAVHFRKVARSLISEHPQNYRSWALNFCTPTLELTNFPARVASSFTFPEETAADVAAMVGPLVKEFDITFHGSPLH